MRDCVRSETMFVVDEKNWPMQQRFCSSVEFPSALQLSLQFSVPSPVPPVVFIITNDHIRRAFNSYPQRWAPSPVIIIVLTLLFLLRSPPSTAARNGPHQKKPLSSLTLSSLAKLIGSFCLSLFAIQSYLRFLLAAQPCIESSTRHLPYTSTRAFLPPVFPTIYGPPPERSVRLTNNTNPSFLDSLVFVSNILARSVTFDSFIVWQHANRHCQIPQLRTNEVLPPTRFDTSLILFHKKRKPVLGGIEVPVYRCCNLDFDKCET